MENKDQRQSTFDKIREALKRKEQLKYAPVPFIATTPLEMAKNELKGLVILGKSAAPDRNKLRPYQIDALDRFANGATIELPAEAGKSSMLKAYLERLKSQGHKIIVCHRGKKRLRKRKIISRPYQDEMAKKLNNFHGHLTNGGKTVLVFTTGRGCGKSQFIKRLENL